MSDAPSEGLGCTITRHWPRSQKLPGWGQILTDTRISPVTIWVSMPGEHFSWHRQEENNSKSKRPGKLAPASARKMGPFTTPAWSTPLGGHRVRSGGLCGYPPQNYTAQGTQGGVASNMCGKDQRQKLCPSTTARCRPCAATTQESGQETPTDLHVARHVQRGRHNLGKALAAGNRGNCSPTHWPARIDLIEHQEHRAEPEQ